MRPLKALPLLGLLVACAAPRPALERAFWHPVATGSSASLRGLHAVDAHVVWAAGSDGTVLKTTDGGNSWSILHVGDDLELRDVHAFDATTAYVLSVTEPASVLRTRDGGDSWEELYRSPHPEAFLDSFTFLDRERAILFGDPIDGRFLILWTDDGGATWHPAESAPAAAEGEAAFAASGTCVVSAGGKAWIGTGGRASRVLRSSDAGRTWVAVPSTLIQGQPTTGIYSLAFRDEQRGVAVGGDYTAPERAERNAATTADGGATWSAVAPRALPRGQRAAVAWVPGHEHALVAVGRTGTDVSVDGGRTWAGLSDQGFYALSFAPPEAGGSGWAVGAEGRAARLVIP
jgi:photosystem II stability/assembly factor-like uncharacterized protein